MIAVAHDAPIGIEYPRWPSAHRTAGARSSAAAQRWSCSLVARVVAALEQMRTRMPFPLRGFDTDNGGEFMNETVAGYCREHGIPCTRSRPYHKNDQAWVEQKNGSVVRRLVGYRRLEGLAAAEALSRLFVNFFQPSFKLAAKTRLGAKVRKTYHAPETPYAKLLASGAITATR